MTKDEVERVAQAAGEAAGKAAARETLIAMGADPDKPHEMQADFLALRRLRILTEKSFVAAILAVIGLAVAAAWNLLVPPRH